MKLNKEEKWLLNSKYAGHECEDFSNDIKQLKKGVPLDYLIGFSDFLGCNIYLDSCPLIPRLETEYWVSRSLPELTELSRKGEISILDLFSGSGCIGVALLKHVPNISVTFAEIEKRHLPTIEKNVHKNNLDQLPHRVMQSDVFSSIDSSFHFIYANPPYIDKSRNEVDDSVIDHEPHRALFADDHGLYYIQKLIFEAPKYLHPGGVLFIEFDSWQKEDILEFANALSHTYHTIEVREDQYGRPRVCSLTRNN